MTRFTSQMQDLHQETIYHWWVFFISSFFSFLEKDVLRGRNEDDSFFLKIWMSVAWNLVPVSTAAWTAMEVTSATVSMVTP